MGRTATGRIATGQASGGQGRLPYEAAEAHLRENLALLKRLAEKLSLPLRARELLIRIALVEHDNGNPLRKTYAQLGERERGLACSERTAFRIVRQLEQLSLIQVERIVTGAGQRPNEYRIDWEGVRRGLFGEPDEPEPGCHFVEPRLSNCQIPVAILSEPGCQNVNHIRNNSLSSLPHSSPSSSTTARGEGTAAAVLEEGGQEHWRDASATHPCASVSIRGSDSPLASSCLRGEKADLITEAYRKGVRKAEAAVERAIGAGRDVAGLLRLFNSVMIGWERAKRGRILYRWLTESPPGLDPGDPADQQALLAGEPFDHPSAVEASRERRRRLAEASGPKSTEAAKGAPSVAPAFSPAGELTPEQLAERRALQEKMRAFSRGKPPGD